MISVRNNANRKQAKERRGVAPIIATLMMVAIAVVGGVAVLAWANDQIGSGTETRLPQPDSITLFGYDARDLNDLRMHNGTTIAVNTASPTTKLEDGTDALTLYLRNEGSRIATINSIEIAGYTHIFDSANAGDASSISTTLPGAGKFLIVGDGTVTTSRATAEVEGGEQVTIVVRFDGDNDLKQGRIVTAKVSSANSGYYSTSIVIGQRDS